jgi:hypothetical protein
VEVRSTSVLLSSTSPSFHRYTVSRCLSGACSDVEQKMKNRIDAVSYPQGDRRTFRIRPSPRQAGGLPLKFGA